MKTFKNLLLKIECLESKIQEFFDIKVLEKIIFSTVKRGDVLKIEIVFTKIEKKLKFDIFILKKGGVTLDFSKYGTSDEDREIFLIPLKDWLLDTCSYDTSNSSFSVKKMKESTFSTFCECIKEDGNFDFIEDEKNKKKIVSKIDRTQLTLTYYETGTLLIQGKPAHCYWSIFKLLIKLDLITLEEEEKIILNSLEKEEENIDREGKYVVTQSIIEKLPEDCQMMLNTYEVLVNDYRGKKLDDYSLICFYPLRVAEAILRKSILEEINPPTGYVLHDKRMILTARGEEKSKEDIIIFNEHKKINSKLDISTPYMRDSIEELYNHYNLYRHGIVHAQEYGGSLIIEEYTKAEEISINAIKLIGNLIK